MGVNNIDIVLDGAKNGLDGPPIPIRVSQIRPFIVVGWDTAQGKAAVDRGRAANDFSARVVDGASFDHLCDEAPVVISRELQAIQDISGRQADAGIVRSGLDEENAATAILGQSRGNHRARRTGTDYDFVEHIATTVFAGAQGATGYFETEQIRGP